MHNKIRMLVGAAVTGMALSASASAQSAAPAAPAAAPAAPAAACTVGTADKAPITAGSPQLTVQLAFTEAIGDSIKVSFAPESKIAVVGVQPGMGQAISASLNTSSAAAGDWPVKLTGTTGECNGSVKVVAAGPGQ
jgi:hypothetical protein